MSLDLHVAHWGTQLVPAPVIVHADAFNGLAFDAHQTWAFKRAELTALAATPFRLANGEQASMSIIRTLPPLSVGADRMIAIGTRLLALTAPKLVALGPSASVGLVLCLPERMAIGREDRTFRAQRERIEKTLATALTGLEVVMHVEARGHASLAFALRQVANALADRTLLAAIVLGLDTYYDPLVVQGLLDRKRLWDGENLDAFVPGEGGFSLLVTTRAIARRAHLGVLASIESAASATEPAPLASTQTSMASGLSAATRAISDRLESEGRRIDW